MKVNMLKRVVVAMLFMVILFSLTYSVDALTLKNMEEKADNFLQAGQTNSNIDIGNVTSEFRDLGNILTMIGAGVMVGVTAYMGIKYLTAGPEAQAKLKTQLIGVIVSGMVIFGAYFIWTIVLRIAATF